MHYAAAMRLEILMATYPTQASFMLPCTPMQADTALEALNHIQGDISDQAAALPIYSICRAMQANTRPSRHICYSRII